MLKTYSTTNIFVNEKVTFEFARYSASAHICEMKTQEIIRALLNETRWKQEDLANRLDTTQSIVSRWLAGSEPRGAKRDALYALAMEYGVLETPEPSRHNIIPVMGLVGAGGDITTIFDGDNPDGFAEVELPFSMPGRMVGFRVDGTSMFPAYEADEIVVCFKEQRRATEWFIGRTAVVQTADEKRYLKRIAKGGRANAYTLRSWNADDIEDVQIVWAGEIVASVKPEGVKVLKKGKDG